VDHLSYKTKSISGDEAKKEWIVLDASGKYVGRFASQVAALLRGKHKAVFTPNVDCGDNVIVVNAEKIIFTGKKLNDKQYISHTGYPGGQRMVTPFQIMKKKPTWCVTHAIKGMLPKNRLGRKLFNNLFVYSGPDHDNIAQQPKQVTLKY